MMPRAFPLAFSGTAPDIAEPVTIGSAADRASRAVQHDTRRSAVSVPAFASAGRALHGDTERLFVAHLMTLTPDELQRAASFLYGLVAEATKRRESTVTLPTRTVGRLADAVLAVCNAPGVPHA